MAKQKKKRRQSRQHKEIKAGNLYHFTADCELSEEEKEMFAEAEVIAEKVHYAGMAAAMAFIDRLDAEEFEALFMLLDKEEVQPEAYKWHIDTFYQAYCNGWQIGAKFADQMLEEDFRDKKITPSVGKR